jgi:hypothetical protein
VAVGAEGMDDFAIFTGRQPTTGAHVAFDRPAAHLRPTYSSYRRRDTVAREICWMARVQSRRMNAYQGRVPIERIPLALTVGRDLGKGRSAQRFPAFC